MAHTNHFTPAIKRLLALRRFHLLLLLSMGLAGFTACKKDSESKPAPDRTPYIGEWYGPLTWVGLGAADNAVISLRASAASAETLDGSFVYAPTMERRAIKVQWNRRDTRWDVAFTEAGATERNGILSLDNNRLKLDFETPNGRYSATLTDARDLWVGSWSSTLGCASGAARPVSWMIRKAADRTGLEIANAGAPTAVIAQGELSESKLVGTVPISGVAHSYVLDYNYFTSNLRLNATAPGNDPCTAGLNR